MSYQSDDRERTRFLADALERRGWPVWWDRDIQAGQAFRNVIGQALDDAACVVVLWSERSVGSEWVQEEAQIAKTRNILIPVLLDDVRQPLGFGQKQSTSIVNWGGHPADPMLDGLLGSVSTLMGFAELPRLLNDAEWETIVASARELRGRAATARASNERSAADAAQGAAERASADREAAAQAGESDAEASRRESELAQAAQIALQAAEEREAAIAAELVEEHAAQLRTMAARKAAREADTRAAEDAAQTAADAAERTARLRAAAAADKEAAEQAAAGRAPEVEARARTIASEAVRAETDWFRFPKEGVATLLGGVLVVVSVFLVWDAPDNTTALDYTIGETDPGGSSLGVLLLVVGIVGGLLAVVRVPRWFTVILGLTAVVVAMTFLVQKLDMLIDGENPEEFFNAVGIGPVVAIVGGLFMLSGR